MYYNTTNETGAQLNLYREQARNQGERIIQVMRDNPHTFYGASDLYKALRNAPLTSVRRALNTLNRRNEIEKTGLKQRGMFGRNEWTYKLAQ